jgi:hypothetical protein
MWAFYQNVKGGDGMKGKVLVLIFLAVFASLATLAFVSSTVQTTEEPVGFVSPDKPAYVTLDFVQPQGIPIDTPGGPT